jgi:hypothetical protein
MVLHELFEIGLIIDEEDVPLIKPYKWYVCKDGYLFRHIKIANKRTTISMHRFISNADKTTQIDHINGNRKDNRKCNLRKATPRQNRFNTVKYKGISKYKGVSWNKKVKKWRAAIHFNKKYYSLGYFYNECDAAIAYNKKALELFGEYAKINVITLEEEIK